MQVDEFDYELPDSAIAQEPIEPRDASRLLLASNLEEIPFRAFPRRECGRFCRRQVGVPVPALSVRAANAACPSSPFPTWGWPWWACRLARICAAVTRGLSAKARLTPSS